MFSNLSKKVKIVEVGPRDGLQNEKSIISTEDKLNYISMLAGAGLTDIEVTSFVNPKAIPQMSDNQDLFTKTQLKLNTESLLLPCLVPNIKGYEIAKSLGVKEIALFTGTSNSFTKKNINATVEESFERMAEITKLANADGIKTRAYVSTAFGCPYEGDMSVSALMSAIEKFQDLGFYELSIGDTIGSANPKQVNEYLTEVLKVIDKDKVAMHFHDTRGMAIANVLVSLEHGISIFDASSGGLGGCPYAKGATGNVATEDLVYLMHSMGIETNVDMDKLVDASTFILDKTGKVSPSKYYHSFLKSRS